VSNESDSHGYELRTVGCKERCLIRPNKPSEKNRYSRHNGDRLNSHSRLLADSPLADSPLAAESLGSRLEGNLQQILVVQGLIIGRIKLSPTLLRISTITSTGGLTAIATLASIAAGLVSTLGTIATGVCHRHQTLYDCLKTISLTAAAIATAGAIATLIVSYEQSRRIRIDTKSCCKWRYPPPVLGPPPPERALAMFTRILRPSSSVSFIQLMALWASVSLPRVTKPNPRERWVSRSRITIDCVP